MRYILLALLAVVPTAGWCAIASDFLARTLPAGGAARALPYRLLVPAGYNAAQSYPLIVFLHGSGERGNDNQLQLSNNARLYRL